MKIQIVSDLHLDFGDCRIENNHDADVLMIAGDTSTGKPSEIEHTKNLLLGCALSFEHVIFTTGNHDYYHSDIKTIDEEFKSLSKSCYNLHYLQGGSLILGDTMFLGGTLWTNFNNENPIDMQTARMSMNDYQTIRGFAPQDALENHNRIIKCLKMALSFNKDKKVVILTHHAPSYESISEEWRGDKLNSAYASDLNELILDNPNIKLWAHGHVHHSAQYKIGECQVVCNPRGYDMWDLNKEFDEDLVVEI